MSRLRLASENVYEGLLLTNVGSCTLIMDGTYFLVGAPGLQKGKES